MKSKTAIVFLLSLPLIFSVASAQRFAEVSGTVTDATGAVLPGVTVDVTSVESGVGKTAITTDAGLYRVFELIPGGYRISAQLDGFKTTVVEATLETMKITTVDIALEIGEVTDQVTVEAAGMTLERESAKVSTFFEEKMIEDLPQLLKRPLDMIKYAAAVSYRGTWNLIPGQSTYYSMNGVSLPGWGSLCRRSLRHERPRLRQQPGHQSQNSHCEGNADRANQLQGRVQRRGWRPGNHVHQVGNQQFPRFRVGVSPSESVGRP